MPRSHTAAINWARRFCNATIIIAAALCLVELCHASDERPKWTVVVHKSGAEIAKVPLALSSPLHDEIESVRKFCVEKSRIDFATYAPSLRIESELERIELRGKSVIYSSRKTSESGWSQRSRRSELEDRLLREELMLLVEKATVVP